MLIPRVDPGFFSVYFCFLVFCLCLAQVIVLVHSGIVVLHVFFFIFVNIHHLFFLWRQTILNECFVLQFYSVFIDMFMIKRHKKTQYKMKYTIVVDK